MISENTCDAVNVYIGDFREQFGLFRQIDEVSFWAFPDFQNIRELCENIEIGDSRIFRPFSDFAV